MSAEKLSVLADSEKTVAAKRTTATAGDGPGKNRWTRIAVECNSIIGRKHRDNRRAPSTTKILPLTDASTLTADNKTIAVTIDKDSSENYNECEDIIFPSSAIIPNEPSATMNTVARASSTTAFTMPSIAVTTTTETSASTSSLSKIGGKRSAKIDFVRFDSVETVYRHTDHDEVTQRATIKDEIKR